MKNPIVVGVTGLAAGLGLQCYIFRQLPKLYRMKWLCDLDDDKIRRGVAEYGGTGTKNFDDMLNDAEVDLVTIATPVSTHASLTKKALMSGKHVLLEKPIAATLTEADELVSLSKKSKGILCIDHQRRFMANQKVVQDMVESKVLGQLFSIRLDLSILTVNDMTNISDTSTWESRFIRTHNYDYLVHHADQICHLLGEKPKQIYGRYTTLTGNDLPCELEISINMPSGILASINVRQSHAQDMKWQIDGEKWSLRMPFTNDMINCFIYQRNPDGSVITREIQRPHLKNTVDTETGMWRPKKDCEIYGYTEQDAHIEFYQHLYVAIRGGGPVPVSAEDARDAIKIIWLAVESARTGKVVDW